MKNNAHVFTFCSSLCVVNSTFTSVFYHLCTVNAQNVKYCSQATYSQGFEILRVCWSLFNIQIFKGLLGAKNYFEPQKIHKIPSNFVPVAFTVAAINCYGNQSPKRADLVHLKPHCLYSLNSMCLCFIVIY